MLVEKIFGGQVTKLAPAHLAGPDLIDGPLISHRCKLFQHDFYTVFHIHPNSYPRHR